MNPYTTVSLTLVWNLVIKQFKLNFSVPNFLFHQLNENNYDRIQSVVSDFYGISIDDLIGKKRHTKYVIPRHIAMYLIKSNHNIPYKSIGSLFGDRDHSTVLTACEKIENELKQDKTLKLAVDTIIKKLNQV